MSGKQVPAVWFPAVRTGSGTEVFTRRLADELRRRGLDVEVTWLPLRAEYAPWTVPVPSPPAWANIAHVNTWMHPRFLPAAMPVVATIHHSVHHPESERYKGPLRSAYHRHWVRAIERETMRRAQCVVAVSEFAARTARDALLDRQIEVIRNGVDTQRFTPSDRTRRRSPFRLLYVGKWTPLKGIDLLAPIMRTLGVAFELRFTGELPESVASGLPKNMRDIGHLHGPEAVAAAMRDADALLFPSRSEGFGLVAAEAMACGLPVIAARGTSLSETVHDGSTGLLCAIDDVEAFSEAARRLALDTALYGRLSSQARAYATASLSMDQMVEAYIDVYRRLLGAAVHA